MKIPPSNASRLSKFTAGSLVSTTIKNAKGKWPHILSALGIDVPNTPNKHAPCPVCQGTDRFRFDDKEGKGTWFCNQCTPQSGDGLNLVCHVLGLTPTQAAKRVNKLLLLNPAIIKSSSVITSKTSQEIEQKTKRDAEKILKETKLGKSFYLVSKKLEGIESVMLNRSLPNLGLFNSPLLVIPFEKNGQLTTLQFIDKKGNKRFLKGTGTQARSYHQIPGKTDYIYIGEGYATTLTSTRLTGCMSYVAGSANNIHSVALIASHNHPLSQIIILVDNDETGIKSLKEIIKCVPNCIGVTPPGNNEKIKDWNDYYRTYGKEKTKKDLKEAIQEKNCSVNIRIENDVIEICRQLEKIPHNDLMDKSEAIDFAVNMINKNHCFVLTNVKNTVVIENRNLSLLNIKSFSEWGEALQIPYIDKQGKGNSLNAVLAWKRNPKRRTCSGMIFRPSAIKVRRSQDGGNYNLWSGFDVKREYVKDWPLGKKFLNHLFDNICDGNKKSYCYLLSWIADIFQHPERKPGVALVLRSEGRGTGKSKVSEVLNHLIGFHSEKVSNMDHLLGKFNEHLSTSIMIVVEESFWAGNKANAGKLRDMITSPTIRVEIKGGAIMEFESFHRIMMITNNDWAIPANKDERRYFVLDVGEHQKQNRPYFKSMTNDLEKGGYAQLMDFFMTYDYSDVDIGKTPRTKGLEGQIFESMGHEQKFWMNCLVNGSIGSFKINETTTTDVAKKFVYIEYMNYLSGINAKAAAVADNTFGTKIKNICPNIENVKTTVQSHLMNKGRTNGYKFPLLGACQKDFEAALNISINWD